MLVNRVKKSPKWKIFLFSVLIFYFLVPFARNIVYQIYNPESAYKNGSFQCWQFELPNEPCSFIDFLFAEVFGVVFWSIILLPFSIIIGIASAILIIMKFKKLKYSLFRNKFVTLIVKIVLYLIVLLASLYIIATVWHELLIFLIDWEIILFS